MYVDLLACSTPTGRFGGLVGKRGRGEAAVHLRWGTLSGLLGLLLLRGEMPLLFNFFLARRWQLDTSGLGDLHRSKDFNAQVADECACHGEHCRWIIKFPEFDHGQMGAGLWFRAPRLAPSCLCQQAEHVRLGVQAFQLQHFATHILAESVETVLAG